MTDLTNEQKHDLLLEKYKALEKKHTTLLDKTRKMRGYQVQYFRYRASADLSMSKRLEREVDDLIASEVQQKKTNQQELF
ncbi:MAG: hypothetical protein WC756_12080 [Taibaiella sp.]|jgi:hypothetical protein